ncbi:DUF6221 family protein [Streptomyces sp. NPDC051940]|uniref:DUF6221 family protein n=1 Tax=Streptomyces sp. NPDC051940 TaxID=3155675 RepID=UPI0034195568
MTDDLIAWLRARLDEEEHIAQATQAERDGWYGREAAEYLPRADVAHITRHSPTQVLAEVETKRAIVDYIMRECDGKLSHVLRLLALPYAWHNDYRPEWLP